MMAHNGPDRSPNRISGLAELLVHAATAKLPPVESWDPPYCGDIGIAIAADGTWSYRGSPIRRQPLVRLFSNVLRREHDGRHFLVTPGEKILVQVADAPFLAVEMEVHGQGTRQEIVFRTNVDDIVRAGVDHPIHFVVDATGGLRPYVRIRGGLDALLTRALTIDLVALAEPVDEDRLAVWSGGAAFVLDAAGGI